MSTFYAVVQNLGSQIKYDGNHFGLNATATNRYGLGMMVDAGRQGVSSSLMMHGSQAGTVDQSGHYEANTDFLSGMNGQDIMDEFNNRAQEDANATLEGAGVEQTKEPEEPTGIWDVLKNYGSRAASAIGDSFSPGGALAGVGAITSAAAAWLAGRGVTGNRGNAVESEGQVARRKEDEDKPPKKQPTKEELANFKDNIFLNTTRAATDDYLAKLDAQGVDTSEMRAHAEAQRASGVRDLTAEEIQAKREAKEAARANNIADNNESNGGFGFDPYNDGTGNTMSDAGVMPAESVNRIDNDLKIIMEREVNIELAQENMTPVNADPLQQFFKEQELRKKEEAENKTIKAEAKAKFQKEGYSSLTDMQRKALGIAEVNRNVKKVDWDKKPNESNTSYFNRTAEEMRYVNKQKVKDENIKSNPEKLKEHLANVAKEFAERYEPMDIKWKGTAGLIQPNGTYSVKTNVSDELTLDCSSHVAAVLYAAGITEHGVVDLKLKNKNGQIGYAPFATENLTTGQYISRASMPAFNAEADNPDIKTKGGPAFIRHSDKLVTPIPKNVPEKGSIGIEYHKRDIVHPATGAYIRTDEYAAHTFIVTDIKEGKYQISETDGVKTKLRWTTYLPANTTYLRVNTTESGK